MTMVSYREQRKAFNLNTAIGGIKDGVLKVDFKSLATMAVICGYYEMSTAKEAREVFIEDLCSILATKSVPELDSICKVIAYDISVSVPCGWRSASAVSKCFIIGGKGYVYDCTVADPPGSKRQSYSPTWWAAREIGKGKIMSRASVIK